MAVTIDSKEVPDSRAATPSRQGGVRTALNALDVADYIVDVLGELRSMAQDSGQQTLGLLIEVAQREAQRQLDCEAAQRKA